MFWYQNRSQIVAVVKFEWWRWEVQGFLIFSFVFFTEGLLIFNNKHVLCSKNIL